MNCYQKGGAQEERLALMFGDLIEVEEQFSMKSRRNRRALENSAVQNAKEKGRRGGGGDAESGVKRTRKSTGLLRNFVHYSLFIGNPTLVITLVITLFRYVRKVTLSLLILSC